MPDPLTLHPDGRWHAPGVIVGATAPPPPVPPDEGFDWSDTNPPWAYESTDDFTANWPAGLTEIDLVTGQNDLRLDVAATLSGLPGSARVVIRLPDGIHSLRSFPRIGTSGNWNYARALWDPRIQGLLGNGPDKCFIQQETNSLAPEQIAYQEAMTTDWGDVVNIGMFRLDGGPTSKSLLAGLTVRSDWQNNLTSVTTSVRNAMPASITLPTPGVHGGMNFATLSGQTAPYGQISHVRFVGAGRILTSAPPFEVGSFGQTRGTCIVENTEVDGRIDPYFDAARTPKTGVLMFNNQDLARLDKCWLHHSAQSRYAMHGASKTDGTYEIVRTKIDHISVSRKPPEASPAALAGFESANGTLLISDSILSADVDTTGWYRPQNHVSLTVVGEDPTAPGRFTVEGTEFRDTVFPEMDGYFTVRAVSNTQWWENGLANTTFIHHPETGARLAPYVHNSSFPISAAAQAAAGISPATHYIVRTS